MIEKNKCKCGLPFIRDNRHVGDQGLESCKPSDNLEYLEFLVKQQEDELRNSQNKRSS